MVTQVMGIWCYFQLANHLSVLSGSKEGLRDVAEELETGNTDSELGTFSLSPSVLRKFSLGPFCLIQHSLQLPVVYCSVVLLCFPFLALPAEGFPWCLEVFMATVALVFIWPPFVCSV